jgi:DNA-binding MarR family transcriptional regulator
MEHINTDSLARFNQLYKKMDEIYHLYAKQMGISDTAFWLLYSLYESDEVFTQRELCSSWSFPPQTINSALKSMERQGIITLLPLPNNQKNKQILLTEEGTKLTKKIIAPLVRAERQTFEGMTQTERESLLSLIQKYAELLQHEISHI